MPDKWTGRLVAATLGGVLAGCAALPPNSFLDPTAVGRFPREYQESGIRRVLTPREAPYGLASAVEPTPDDLVPDFSEYRLGPLDQIQLTIDDLVDAGRTFQTLLEIDNAGYIRIPRLGRIRVVGMTEYELEQDLRRRLIEMRLLPDPIVQVLLAARRSMFFSAIGSVRQNGPFGLIRPDTRLLDVVAQLGDVDASARRLYIIRQRNPREGMGALGIPDGRGRTPEIVIPPPDDGPSFSGQVGDPQRGDMPVIDESIFEQAQPRPQPLIYDPARDMALEAPPPTQPSSPVSGPVDDFDWDDVPEFEMSQRVIEIELESLRSGDPRQNVVIRDRDVIYVPIDVGVFYLMGEINRPGVYAFNNREITIKQALGAIGGGFTPLAWPQRCEIIRREPGTDKQLTIPINVDAVYAGLEDDVLLRDGDVVNVGTHIAAPFLFVIRNSFRFTYGFGFVYDRNFADQDAISARPNPETLRIQRRQSQGLPF